MFCNAKEVMLHCFLLSREDIDSLRLEEIWEGLQFNLLFKAGSRLNSDLAAQGYVSCL